MNHGVTGFSVVLQEWQGICIEKEGASEIIRDVSVAFPNTVTHLKRVRPGTEGELYVLLFPVQDDVQLLVNCSENQSRTQNKSCLILFPNEHLPDKAMSPKLTQFNPVLPDRVHDRTLYSFTAYVPVIDPETKQGRDLAASYWPCAFPPIRVDPVLPAVIQGVNRALKCIQELIQSGKIKGKIQQKEECAEVSCILEDDGSPIAYIRDNENGRCNFTQHAVIRMIRDVSAQTEAYLCTKRVAVLSQEPCFVCAAALVHSRIGQVFIRGKGSDRVSDKGSDRGSDRSSDNCHPDGPFTTSAIHMNQNLNHRFNVYFVEPEHEHEHDL